MSDKHVTENSGVLRKLRLRDIVLADRGFDIADSVGYYQAKLYIPAFTKGIKGNCLHRRWKKQENLRM